MIFWISEIEQKGQLQDPSLDVDDSLNVAKIPNWPEQRGTV